MAAKRGPRTRPEIEVVEFPTKTVYEPDTASYQGRVQYLVWELERGNATEFSRRCGILPSSLSHFFHGETTGASYAHKIVTAYPQVNEQWLVDGIGYPGDISVSAVKAHYESLLRQRDQTIAVLSEALSREQAKNQPPTVAAGD